MRRDAGFTLLEMTVAVALLGILAAVAGLAMRADAAPDPARERALRIESVRRQALVERHAVRFVIDSAASGQVTEAVALPDGRVLADSAAAVDALTGRPR